MYDTWPREINLDFRDPTRNLYHPSDTADAPEDMQGRLERIDGFGCPQDILDQMWDALANSQEPKDA